jgi:hypothetical protein
VTSQKPRDKKAPELTSEEAMRKLFHPDVIEHAKKHVREAEERGSVSKKKLTNEE